VFIKRTFNMFRYELLFIGLSVLLIVGIGLLPKSPPTPDAPVAPVTTVALTPVPAVPPENRVTTPTSDPTPTPISEVQLVTENRTTLANFTNPQSRAAFQASRSLTKFVQEILH